MGGLRKQISPATPAVKRYSSIHDDSPSRQLMSNLENALFQVQIHEGRLNELYARDCQAFHDSLDRQDEEDQIRDAAAIQAATDRHDWMRAEAEAALADHYAQIEAEEQKRAEEERLRLEAERARAQAAAEKKAREEADRQARVEQERQAAQKAAEDKAKAAELETLKREIAAKQKRRKEAEEAEQAAAARQKAEQQRTTLELAGKAAAAAETQKQQADISNTENARIHQRYLQIHQSLKKFRKSFWDVCKANPALKAKVGEMRRALKVSVGQLVEKTAARPQANTKPVQKVKQVLQEAVGIESPKIDSREFFATVPSDMTSPELAQVPSLLVYAFNIFSKAIITQFANEAGLSLKAAEPAGVLTAQMFSGTAFKVNGHSLIDILLAKLHFSCPAIWGAVGDEKTPEGKRKLGWRMEDGHFVSETRHQERMTGLAAGFAAISLRNFSKTQLRNPYPPINFWDSLATIVNIPASLVQPTHLFILRAMLDMSTDRFVQAFGTAAIAGLRHALVSFPASLPPPMRSSSSATALSLLRERLAKEKNLRLV